ncbi:MAG: MarR family winged helix-turn-helix transcriptional regulator [Steroidobacteraceae bacterium]
MPALAKRTDEEPLLRLETFLPYRLSVVSNTISNAIAAAYSARFDLSIPEWRVMAVLGATPDLAAAEVAERTAMDKVAVSRSVASLLQSGRLLRRTDANDRRRSILRLSARGQAVYNEVAPLALGYERALLAGLDDGDRRALERILNRLQQAANATPHRPHCA